MSCSDTADMVELNQCKTKARHPAASREQHATCGSPCGFTSDLGIVLAAHSMVNGLSSTSKVWTSTPIVVTNARSLRALQRYAHALSDNGLPGRSERVRYVLICRMGLPRDASARTKAAASSSCCRRCCSRLWNSRCRQKPWVDGLGAKSKVSSWIAQYSMFGLTLKKS